MAISRQVCDVVRNIVLYGFFSLVNHIYRNFNVDFIWKVWSVGNRPIKVVITIIPLNARSGVGYGLRSTKHAFVDGFSLSVLDWGKSAHFVPAVHQVLKMLPLVLQESTKKML